MERKLRLKVNQEKSAVARPYERKFLGLRILRSKEAIIGIAPKSIVRFKKRVRQITKRNRGISLARMIEELNRFRGDDALEACRKMLAGESPVSSATIG